MPKCNDHKWENHFTCCRCIKCGVTKDHTWGETWTTEELMSYNPPDIAVITHRICTICGYEESFESGGRSF